MCEVTPPKIDRRFDMIAIMGWQSRGHEAIGFEIKVSRSDWLAELKNPAKADPLVTLCSRWFVASPPNVVRVEELPTAWGLMVIHPDQIRISKQAPNLSPTPWSDETWRCMMLRQATRDRGELSEMYKKGYNECMKSIEEQEKRAENRVSNRIAELQEIIKKAEEHTGVSLHKLVNFPMLGKAMAVLRADEIHAAIGLLEEKANKIREIGIRMRLAARKMKAMP